MPVGSQSDPRLCRGGVISWTLGVVGVGSLVWGGIPVLGRVVEETNRNPEYSHLVLIPFVAAYLLWTRVLHFGRDGLRPGPPRKLTALMVTACAGGTLCLGGIVESTWLEGLGLIGLLLGVVLILSPPGILSLCWPVFLILALGVPIPYRMLIALSGPLRSLSTELSVFLIRLIGIPTISRGVEIDLGWATVQVAEACSGLGLLIVSLTFSVALASTARCNPLSWTLSVLGAVPAAILANTGRIVGTALAMSPNLSGVDTQMAHDLAGWVEIPLCFALLVSWNVLIAHCFVPLDRPPGNPTTVQPTTPLAATH